MKTTDKKSYDKLALIRGMRSVCNVYGTICNQSLAAMGLTGTQGEVLFHLLQNPSEMVETEKLRKELSISPAAMSGTLKKLSQKGYIRYLTEKKDLRKKKISLTVKALDNEDQLVRKMQHLEDTMYERLTDAECEEVQQFLRTVLENMSDFQERS